jgi:molybdopterin-guanine dinucleotide biosynthesis protein B
MNKPYVFQVTGYKNRGKTTLICGLIEQLTKKGYRVGTIKHDGHDFEMDSPGKDTWNHRQAGAETVAIASANQTAILYNKELVLSQLIESLSGLDIIVIEGYKRESYPKIVIVKYPEDIGLLDNSQHVLAAVFWTSQASDQLVSRINYPLFHIDDIEGLTDFLMNQMKS